MRRLLPITAVAAITVIASQFAGASGTRIAQEETIVLTEVTTAVSVIDAGNPHAFSVGDLVALRARLEDETSAKVGTDRANCVSNKGSIFVCSAQYTIEGRGDVTAQWVQDFASIIGSDRRNYGRNSRVRGRSRLDPDRVHLGESGIRVDPAPTPLRLPDPRPPQALPRSRSESASVRIISSRSPRAPSCDLCHR